MISVWPIFHPWYQQLELWLFFLFPYIKIISHLVSLNVLSSFHPSLLHLQACDCCSKSCFYLPLQATYICLLSVKTKENDHTAYYSARSWMYAVCMNLCSCTHTQHTHAYQPFTSLLPPYLMWCQSHVFQASSSVNQNQTFIFNCLKPLPGLNGL